MKSVNIGRIGEKKSKEYLKRHNYTVYASSINSPGVDIIAFKDGVVYLIEVKTTKQSDIPVKRLINMKQLNYYKSFANEIREQGFTVEIQLHVWRFINNCSKSKILSYKLEIINYEL